MTDYGFALDEVEVSKIDPSPDNPRGPNVRDNDTQFEYLKRSIQQFGLLVPLVVKKTKNGDERYVLVDGERRYYALKELGEKTAPAHVITGEIPDEVRTNVMFHIHTNRVQWNPHQQCKALEPIYNRLKDKFGTDEARIVNDLIRLTGTNRRTIVDRMRFLKWPTDVKTHVYREEPQLYWTVVEIEVGIIEPAAKNFPKYFEKVPKDDVREYLFGKYLQRTAHASTEPRKAKYIVHASKGDPAQHKYAFKIFKKLVEQVDYTFEEAKEEFLSRFPEAETACTLSARQLCNRISKLARILREYDVSLLKKATPRQKSGLGGSLDELEAALEDFKKDSQQ